MADHYSEYKNQYYQYKKNALAPLELAGKNRVRARTKHWSETYHDDKM
jgi:hypothetical protein